MHLYADDFQSHIFGLELPVNSDLVFLAAHPHSSDLHVSKDISSGHVCSQTLDLTPNPTYSRSHLSS